MSSQTDTATRAELRICIAYIYLSDTCFALVEFLLVCSQVTANMLASLHVPWVMLGHSDRKQNCGETNKTAACKVAHALSCGLRVVACIGETLEERQKGSVTKVMLLHW